MNDAKDGTFKEAAVELLQQKFAPWVQDLHLQIESSGPIVLRLANRAEFTRIGGIICGQALMAAADTAMVLAVAEQNGGFFEMATITMNTSFFAPAMDEDVQISVALNKVGKTLAFGDVHMHGATSQRLCAQATITYSLSRPQK